MVYDVFARMDVCPGWTASVVCNFREQPKFFLNRKIFKGYCILCCMLHEKIVAFLRKDGGPCTQKEISGALPGINRAVLLGYLRCLVDVGEVKSKDSGRAKVYYL